MPLDGGGMGCVASGRVLRGRLHVRNRGGGGEEIAPLVAERLGFRLINEEIVGRAAREAEVDPRLVADVERRASLVSRVLERLGPSVGAASAMGGYMGEPGLDTPDRDALRGLIRSTIAEVAAQGRVVIVAHAASFALGDRGDTLRVSLTASPQTRAARIAGEGDAAKRLARSDVHRADYLKRFYGVSAEQPHHYDIVLNTDRLATPDAAALIVAVATA